MLINESETFTGLSSQELIDCDVQNDGCIEGAVYYALDYALTNQGLNKLDDYKLSTT